jgi:DNA-binding CsgD family transcriptional regulator
MNLVERDREFSILDALLTACTGGQGGVALVSGPTGTGKTALLRNFGEHAARRGALILRATAASAERDLQFEVMGQLMSGADLPAREAATAAALVESVTEAGGQHSQGSPELVKGVIPRISSIILEQARERPVVIIVDDIQHADSLSLECLLYLVRRLEGARLVMVLGEGTTFSLDDLDLRVELRYHPGCRQLRTGRLSARGVAELMSSAAVRGRPLPSPQMIYRISGGNPLLVRALLDDHHSSDGTSEAFSYAVNLCLFRSDPVVRMAARILAVLGDDANRTDLAALLGRDAEAAERSLRVLEEMGMVRDRRFNSESVRLAVLRHMEPEYRARVESRIASVLHDRGAPAALVARHLVAADRVEGPWILPTLLVASERALDDDDVSLSLECLRVARDAFPDGPESVVIKAALARAAWRVNPAMAVRYLPELSAASQGGWLSARDVMVVIRYLLWFGRTREALAVKTWLDGRTAIAHEQSEPVDADILGLWMAYAYPGVALQQRSDQVSPRPEHLSTVVSPNVRAALLVSSALVGWQDDDQALRAEQILAVTRLEDRGLLGIVAALTVLLLSDRLDRAAFWCERLVSEAAERNAPTWQALLMSLGAFVELRRGRLAEAVEAARTALELVSAEGWGVVIAVPLAALVFSETVQGNLEAAEAYLSVPMPDAAFDTIGGLWYLWARGHYHLTSGHPHAALDDFHACGDLMTKWDLDLPALVPWRTEAAQIYLRLGMAEHARGMAEEQLAMVGLDRTWVRGASLRVYAATLEPQDRPAPLSEAVEILDETGHSLDLAGALDDLGRAQRELGAENVARALSRKAMRLLRESGAVSGPLGVLEEPDEAEPRAALSDAELRVAVLAAEGNTNRQIADRLFITVSTVEQHLTRIYRKLDVQRRTDLRTKLGFDAMHA